MSLTAEQITPALIGALVRYDDSHRDPEYGLVRSYTEAGIFYVSFHLGDTAAGCKASDLTLIVPADRPQDAAPPVPELDADTYNDLMEFLLVTMSWDTRSLKLAERVKNQVGRSAQKRAGRYH